MATAKKTASKKAAAKQSTPSKRTYSRKPKAPANNAQNPDPVQIGKQLAWNQFQEAYLTRATVKAREEFERWWNAEK